MGCGHSQVLPAPAEENYKDSVYIRSICAFIRPPKPKLAFEDDNPEKSKLFYSLRPRNKFSTEKFDPRVLFKYEVKALLRRGNFSKVFSVEKKGTKEPFAIKVVNTKEKKTKERCQSELSVLGRVCHKYIIRLVEVFEGVEKCYMVMQLATGGELFDRIASRNRFTERDAVKILQMILAAVKHLHGLGITHRDLKPQNILYQNSSEDSKILLANFEFASTRKSGDDVTMTELVGTPEYNAPEVVSRKPYTCAIDNWAIGVITYYMLSGIRPFFDENVPEIHKKIINQDYTFNIDPWPRVSDLAKHFITLFLSGDPSERMTATKALKHPWMASNSNQSRLDLHRSISQNFQRQALSRNSVSSEESTSYRSLRSQHRTFNVGQFQAIYEKYYPSNAEDQ